MSIIRTKRSRNYTVIPNEILEDKRLRLQDKGLLAYLLSKPATWQIRADVMSKDLGVGKDGIYSILKNIREAGYATYTKHADGTTDWVIFDEPQHAKPDLEKPDLEKPDLEKPDLEKPDLEKPDLGFPDDIVSTDIEVSTDIKKVLNKEKINKKEKSVFVLPDWIDLDAWDAFVDMRKQIKKPLTEHAKKLAVDRLWKLKQEGNDPVEALNQSTLNGYQGIFEVKKQSPPTKQKNKKFDPLESIYKGAGYGNKRETESRIIDIDGTVAYEEPKIQKLISN